MRKQLIAATQGSLFKSYYDVATGKNKNTRRT